MRIASTASVSAASGIAIVEQGEYRGAFGQKGVFRRIGLASSRRRARCEPAVGDACFAAEGGAVPGQPDRHAGGRALVAAAAVGAIGALARIEHHLREVEPPGRQAETFERLRRFLNGEQPLEGALRVLPLASVQAARPPARSSTR